MFELRVERSFSAAHAISIRGRLEPLHGHDWGVTAVVRGARLDDDGLLCDFHLIERQLDAIIAPLHNRCLNETPPFDRVNPTAENVARHIGERLEAGLPQDVVLHGCRVSEAPGCTACYLPE